mgnify:CR=1 FL=1
MPNEIKRNYGGINDAEMLEANKTMREFFVQDKAEFVAFDADFNDPYADNWANSIVTAEIAGRALCVHFQSPGMGKP